MVINNPDGVELWVFAAPVFMSRDIRWGLACDDYNGIYPATDIELPFGVPTHQQEEVQAELAQMGLCLRFDTEGRACGVAVKEFLHVAS